MCRLKCALCHGCGSSRLWIYFTFLTFVTAFIWIWPNFGIGWATYHGGTNTTWGLWQGPFAFGGDLLLTVVAQTCLTFTILSFLVSWNRKNGDWWFGVKVVTQKLPSKCCAPIFKWTRPYVYTDLQQGLQGVGWGFLRLLLTIFIWILLIGLPATIITCVKYLPHYRFLGTHLAIAKGIYGFVVATIQAPVFIWWALIEEGTPEMV